MESQLIGEADVWLNALANMVEFSAETSVLSVFGQLQGKMGVEINPCDRNGRAGGLPTVTAYAGNVEIWT